MPRVFFALLACVLLGGCLGSEVGPFGRKVGGPCRDVFDCGAGSFCAGGREFPDGMCVVNCRSDTDCPDGALCAEQRGGLCLPSCEDELDCREGYRCTEQVGRTGGTVDVCLNE